MTGESCFEVKIEADNNDITEHPHDDKPTPFVCSVCNKRFMRKDILNLHRKTHTGNNVYSCNECGKCCSSLNSLRLHMNIHRRKHSCTECGKCCESPSHLARHMRSHSGEKPFECTVCNPSVPADDCSIYVAYRNVLYIHNKHTASHLHGDVCVP